MATDTGKIEREVAGPAVRVRCLAGLVDAMRYAGLSVAELAQRASIEEALLRGAILCRVSLDAEEIARLAEVLSSNSRSIQQIGETESGEIQRLLK